MNLNDFELDLVKRENVGTSDARVLRNSGHVPATIYGSGKSPISAYIKEDVLNRALGSRTLFNKFTKLNFGKESVLAFAKIVQKHPVTDRVLHIDFQIVEKGGVITMKVPVTFINKELCETIKLGGLLNIVSPFLEMKGTAEKMPSSVVVDLKDAKVGISIKVEHLVIPEGVKVTSKFVNKVVATILAAKKKGGDASTEESAGDESAA